MAIRIARTVGGSPESWLRMQEALDLWNAEMKFKNNICNPCSKNCNISIIEDKLKIEKEIKPIYSKTVIIS